MAKPSASGQAQLRPSAAASAAPSASPNPQQAAVEKAYYQAVGTRLGGVVRSFAAALADLKASSDPSKDVGDLSAAVGDLGQHLGDAPPPDALKQQHLTLGQAVPLMQGDIDQLKSAIDQKNGVQAVLIAAEFDSLLNQVPDEVAFATAPHPELYQPIETSQQLTHVLNVDVITQNVSTRNNMPASIMLRIAVQSGNPSNEEVSDTLRHSVVAARQTYPQVGQVRVLAFKEANGAVGAQVGSADWYCSPDARAPDASASSNWQDSCGKVYVTVAGSPPTTVPY
ncbi:MAG TPA: hypothetical protein VF157_10445 [Chloroflexota bacterium]